MRILKSVILRHLKFMSDNMTKIMARIIMFAIILKVMMLKVILAQNTPICYNPSSNCFDPSSAQSLVFQQGQYTSCARVPPISQLNCVDGNSPNSVGLCAKYSKYITNFKCANSGSDGSGGVNWACETYNIPNGILIGSTTISCEGCKSSTDNLKISNSCGLFYSLISTDAKTDDNTNSNNTNKINKNISGSEFVIYALVIFFGIFICCIYCVFLKKMRRLKKTWRI